MIKYVEPGGKADVIINSDEEFIQLHMDHGYTRRYAEEILNDFKNNLFDKIDKSIVELKEISINDTNRNRN